MGGGVKEPDGGGGDLLWDCVWDCGVRGDVGVMAVPGWPTLDDWAGLCFDG